MSENTTKAGNETEKSSDDTVEPEKVEEEKPTEEKNTEEVKPVVEDK